MRLIDADALVNTLKGLRALTNILSGCRERPNIPYDDVVRMIEKSLTIDPVRKGKWIDGRCSQCGGEAYWKGRRDVYGWQEFALELTKYCPNCGSLNKEEGD